MTRTAILISAFVLAALPSLGQSVAFSGTVTNKANGQKLQGVILVLAKADLSDTTDSLGGYRFGNATGILPGLPGVAAQGSGPSLALRDGVLWIQAEAGASVRISIFTLRGTRLARIDRDGLLQGNNPVTLPAGIPDGRILLIRMESGGVAAVYRYTPSAVSGGARLEPVPDGESSAFASAGIGAAKTGSARAASAAVDTLKAVRTGYVSAALPLDSYAGTHDIALEPEATGCASGAICWDFEEGRVPDGWTAYRNEFSGSLLVDGTKPHKGAFALHAKDLAGGAVGSQGGPKRTIKYALPPDFGPVLWGRAFVFTTPARPVSHAGLFNARYPRPGSVSTAVNAMDWYEFATYQEKYMAVWHPPEPPGFPEWVLQSDKPLVLDAWTCLEWEFNGANGTAPEAADPRVWVDGVELSWPVKFTFSDPAGAAKPKMEKPLNFAFLETGVYLYQGLPVATNWWIDDLAVGARRIGCN